MIQPSAITGTNPVETYSDNWVADTTSSKQLTGNIAGPVNWNGKSQTRTRPGAHQGIYTDHLAIRIQQRPT